MADLQKTGTPGIYRRHSKSCDGKRRCDCVWVIVWRHNGRQYKETCSSFNEARAKKAAHESGELQPPSKTKFGDYFPDWIENFSGLTSRGFSETTRPEYRRPIATYAMPIWKGEKLSDIDRGEVRRLFMSMRKEGKSTSVIKKLRVALSALYETAIEDELVRHNPAKGVRIPAPLTEEALIDERPVNIVLLNSFGKLTRTADARRIRKWMAARNSQKVAAGKEVQQDAREEESEQEGPKEIEQAEKGSRLQGRRCQEVCEER